MRARKAVRLEPPQVRCDDSLANSHLNRPSEQLSPLMLDALMQGRRMFDQATRHIDCVLKAEDHQMLRHCVVSALVIEPQAPPFNGSSDEPVHQARACVSREQCVVQVMERHASTAMPLAALRESEEACGRPVSRACRSTNSVVAHRVGGARKSCQHERSPLLARLLARIVSGRRRQEVRKECAILRGWKSLLAAAVAHVDSWPAIWRPCVEENNNSQVERKN